MSSPPNPKPKPKPKPQTQTPNPSPSPNPNPSPNPYPHQASLIKPTAAEAKAAGDKGGNSGFGFEVSLV